jgi:hypothetical protein
MHVTSHSVSSFTDYVLALILSLESSEWYKIFKLGLMLSTFRFTRIALLSLKDRTIVFFLYSNNYCCLPVSQIQCVWEYYRWNCTSVDFCCWVQKWINMPKQNGSRRKLKYM